MILQHGAFEIDALGDNAARVLLGLQVRLLHWLNLLILRFGLVIFGSFGQVEGGIDLRSALLAEGRQLEGDRLSQPIAGLQLQLGRLSRDLMEVYEAIFSLALLQRGFNERAQLEEKQLL